MRFTLRFLPIGLLAGYWVLLCAGTHWPARGGGPLPISDKLLHFGAFFGLALLAAWTAAAFGRFNFRTGAAILVLAALYGLADEWTQGFVPGRTPSWKDWLADLSGAAAGVLAFTALHHLRLRSQHQQREED